MLYLFSVTASATEEKLTQRKKEKMVGADGPLLEKGVEGMHKIVRRTDNNNIY